MIINSIISNRISLHAFVRTGFLLFMSLYISVGPISQYLDSFETNEIELAEERDIESEKKEGKEEVEKDEFLNRLFFLKFSNEQKLHLRHSLSSNWDLSHGEVPTPPPRR